MRFKKASLRFVSANRWDTEKFTNFRDEFGVEGYYWVGGTPTMSASYFVNLLQYGKSVRKYVGKHSVSAYYRHFSEFSNYFPHIFDHTMFWKLSNRQVICTSMPYATREQTTAKFAEMVEEFSFPTSIKLSFLDDKFKYRLNGDFMIMIYDEGGIKG